MAVNIPQVITPDSASGAQVINGCLRFDAAKGQFLKFTPSASGNRRTQTLSVWIKNTYTGSENKIILGGGDNASGPRHNIAYSPTKRFGVTQNPTGSTNNNTFSDGVFRDYSGWQHLVMSLDCTVGQNSGQVRIYVNGKLQDNGGYSGGSAAYITDQDGIFNTINKRMYLGHYAANPSDPAEFDGYMSQFYWIDGLALGPKYFGYTDPLTNTWRPKKFRAEGTTLNDGTDWSGSTTNLTNGPNGFNGNLGNYAEVSSSGAKGTVTFPKSIKVENSVTFWYSSGQAGNLFINDETTAMEVTGGFHQQDIEFTGTLSSVSIQSASQPAIWGIAVDGTILESSVTQNLAFGTNGCYLPFDGSAPIGEDQAPSPNDGTVWSAESSLTTTTAGTSESGSLAAVFNGTINANAANAYGYLNGAFDFTWTPDTPISYSNKVRVWTGYGGGTVSLNGGSNVSSVGNNWTTLADGSSGTITSINFAVGSGGGWWSALEVDGVMLVDSQIGNSWTPVNFGGSNSIEKATGALPILNTINGGNVARPGVFGSDVSTEFTVTTGTYDSATRYELDGVDRPNPTLIRGATYTFDYTAVAGHPLYLSSLPDGKHNSKARSVSFNGSSQSLSISGSSDYYIGTGDFTIEGFVWSSDPTANGVYNRIFAIDGPSGDTSGNLQINVDTSAGNLIVWSGGGNIATGSRNICDSKWHHFAVTRAGRALKIFFDGIEEVSVTNTDNWGNFQSGQPRPEIGARSNSSGWWDGYISNVRLTVGQSLYISDFTPPTTTLTTTSQGADASKVKLICCQDVASTTAAKIASGSSITANGSAPTVNAYNPFLYNNVHGNFGVNTSTSNVTKITIPHYASDLYYYCNQHPNMGNTTAMSVVTDTEKADPYAWKNVLAMPLDGNGADMSGLVNCTTSTKAITTAGSPAADSYSNFYRSAIDFTASSGTGYYPTGAQSDFTFGAGDFTVEFWFKPTTTSRQYITDFRNNGSGGETGNKPFIIFADNGSDSTGTQIRYANNTSTPNFDLLGGNGLPTSNTWHHLAVVRSGTTVSGYLNGVLTNSTTDNTNYTADTSVTVGNSSQVSLNFDGSIQDYRIYKGVAKYTGNFIPAATNPDILPDTPSGVATKSKVKKITDGAVSFDGTSDEVNVTGHSDLTFGTGNFTIECFAYFNSFDDTYPTVLSKLVDSTLSWIVRVKNDGKLVWYSKNGSGTNNESSTTPIGLKRWHHIAVVREGTGSNQLKGYVDGKEVLTMTDANDYNDTNALCIGTQQAGGGNTINGYISNVRLVKGTAVYTSDFTPPTRTLTNVTNTKLLCCQSNTEPGGAVVAPTISGINDGTQWSSKVTPGSEFRSGYGPENAFNGTVTNDYNGTTAVQINQTGFVEFDFGDGIAFSTLQLQLDDNNVGTVVLTGANGAVDITSQLPTGSFTNTTITGVTSPLKKLRMNKTTTDASSLYLKSITIDGVMLRDPVTPNGDAAATTFNPFNTDINTVRGQEGSYCTWNALTKTGGTLSKGNLKFVGSSNWQAVKGTFSVSSGKWYYEATTFGNTYGTAKGNVSFGIGWYKTKENTSTNNVDTAGHYVNLVAFSNNGWWNNFGAMQSSVTSTTAGDVIGVALDKDNNTFEFYKNGISVISGTLANTTDDLSPWNNCYYTNSFYESNFGQKPFKFPPPDGFQPLTSSIARPDTVIARSDKYFSNFFYTGDGTSSRNLTMPLAADFLWVKKRSATNSHQLVDTVRGDDSVLHTNSANPAKNPQTQFTGGGISSISGTTATLSSGTSNNNNVNDDGSTLVGWAWKAGGSAGTFNIDDVDVGSAANAKMNDGGLNSEVYNQDYVWSANYSGNNGVAPTPAFDGTGPKKDGYAHQGAQLVLNFPGAGLSGRIVVYGGTGGGSADTFTLSDGHSLSAPTLYDAAPYYDVLDFGVKSNITQLTCSSGYTLYGITVDGKLLVDQGVTPPNAPSIPSTGCSVGTKQGFSIIKYTADLAEVPNSIAHGLTQKPDFAIFKNLDSTLGAGEVDWGVYHSAMTGSKHLELNDLRAPSTDPGAFNGTEPTSKLFYLGGKRSNSIQSHAYLTNGPANDDFIAYIWHNVPGLQKFGTYEGNGTDDGACVETGFRPALVWTRAYSQNSNNNCHWLIYDTLINPNNESDQILYANLSNGQGSHSSIGIDILSNGFKLKADTAGYSNYSGWSYLYCAWAEAPAFNLYGAQSTAR